MKRKINYTHIAEPTVFENVFPTYLTNETMMARKQKVLQRMETEKFDQLVFYADKEHGSNFEYLTGFIPRFEEGLLVLNKDGTATLILGNENLKLVPTCTHLSRFNSLSSFFATESTNGWRTKVVADF